MAEIFLSYNKTGRSLWSRGLRRPSATIHLQGLRVRVGWGLQCLSPVRAVLSDIVQLWQLEAWTVR